MWWMAWPRVAERDTSTCIRRHQAFALSPVAIGNVDTGP